MPEDVGGPRTVSASAEVGAPADVIFELIADPSQQPWWDGNDNLAEAPPGQRVRAVGEVFTMVLSKGSVRENHVVEFEEGRRIAWLPADPGEPPAGHLWRWELEPTGAASTNVTHTYDWSQLTDEDRFARARSTTSENLRASLLRLAQLAAQPVSDRVAAFWDSQAPGFDDEPDHGLRDADVRRAWTDRLRTWLPQPPADVVDLGCGTATLSTLLAQEGHRVTGVDLSEAMIRAARAKAAAAGVDIQFHHGDAAAPPVAPASVDVVVVRHLLWTLPAPHRALATWARLLRPDGRLVLIEGCWDQGDTDDVDDQQVRRAMPWFGGVDAETLATAVRPLSTLVTVHDLSSDESLWGRPVGDERFALVAQIG